MFKFQGYMGVLPAGGKKKINSGKERAQKALKGKPLYLPWPQTTCAKWPFSPINSFCNCSRYLFLPHCDNLHPHLSDFFG